MLNSSPVLSPDVVFNALKSQETPGEVVSAGNGTREPGEGAIKDRRSGGSSGLFPNSHDTPDGLPGKDEGLNEPSDNFVGSELDDPRNGRREPEFTK